MSKATDKKPYVANYPPLRDWLDSVGAHCLWQLKNGVSMVEGWVCKGTIIVIEVYPNHHGWNIYTACRDPKVDATLKDAEARTGWRPTP